MTGCKQHILSKKELDAIQARAKIGIITSAELDKLLDMIIAQSEEIEFLYSCLGEDNK